MKLRTKLISGFAMLILLVICISVISIGRFIDMSRLSEEAIKESYNRAFAFEKEIDHLKWINSVTDLFLVEDIHELQVEIDDTKCGLGRWIFGNDIEKAAEEDPALNRIIEAMKIPHAELHLTAVEIDNLYRDFDRELLSVVNNAWIAHLNWVRELNMSMLLERGFKGETNPRLCDFGKWFYSFSTDDSRLQLLMEAWEEPHERLHASAVEISADLQGGNMRGAMAVYQSSTLPSLEKIGEAKDETLEYLNGIEADQLRAREIFSTRTMDALEETQGYLAQLVGYYENRAASARSDMEARMTQVIYIISFVSLFIMVLGIFLAIFLTRNILRQLGEDPSVISKITSQIAKGDMQLTLDRKENQSVGVYRSMIQMVDSLAEKSRVIESFAAGDLRVAVEKVSDVDGLGESLQIMKDSFNEILGHVHAAVDQVTAGSDQVSQASQHLSQGATEQAASLEEISSTMTEVNSQSQENALKATEANSLARQAAHDAETGNEHMNQLIQAMKRITDASREIEQVVNVIDDIAFQINLLALNANVEAARAGKYGKGFAVVADEVRNLATRSGDAVKETSEIIRGSLANIKEGDGLVRQTAQQLTEIVSGVTKVADFLKEIAAGSSEQATAIGEISAGLDQIDQVTQGNTASAEESASSAEELSSQAVQLREMISRFQLDTGNRLLEDHTA